MVRVIGVDPGETSGFAVCTCSGGEAHVERTGEWHGMDELNACIDEGLFDNIDVMVVERYVIYPNRANSHIGDQLYTAQEIGRLKWIAHGHNIPVVEQAASMAKQRWPDSRLVAHDYNPLHVSLHRVDALRHALTYLEKNTQVWA